MDWAALSPQERSLRLPLAGIAVGAVALLVSIALAVGNPGRLLQAYLVSWLFYLSLGLGALFFVLVQFASRAGWSVVVRRVAEHVMATLPLTTVLFLPIVWGIQGLYPWSDPSVAADDPLLEGKSSYLNSSFFYVRSFIYLLSWSAIAWCFRRQSLMQDKTGDPALTRKLQTASAPALVWFGLTVTFASFDWIMSLEPHWYSTIFGVYFFSGCAVAIFALLVVLIFLLQRRRGLPAEIVTPEHYHDLGKFLFGFVVFWAYIAFSQYLLIWYANIPEETVWYARRLSPGWLNPTRVLAMGHFVLPFFFLLPRKVKRARRMLLAASVWILLMHYLDLYWLVMPVFFEGFRPHPLDAAVFLALGGFLLAWLGFLLGRAQLLPIKDPRLEESLSLVSGLEN